MKTKKINVLLTDANHPVTPSAVKILKKNNEYSIRVIGTDSSDLDYGALWTDKFYNLPKPQSNSYIKSLLDVCKKEKVDVIVPWTNAEALVISNAYQKFKKINTLVLCNDAETTQILVDKGLTYESLKKSNIAIPKYKLVSDAKQLKRAVSELGYPHENVVVKPTNYSGGRGLWVLDPKYDLVSRDKNKHLPLDAFLSLIKSLDSNKRNNLSYIVMEYLKGEDYSVDILCKKGDPLFIVQRKRFADSGGVSSAGETTYDQLVRNTVVNIIKHFNIDLNCNIQLRYRIEQKGKPYVYDINPRISGTIVVNNYAGIDLLTYGIYQTLGIPLPKNQPKKYRKLKMVRHWSEKYKYSDEFFPS